jgi:hypothetical protein
VPGTPSSNRARSPACLTCLTGWPAASSSSQRRPVLAACAVSKRVFTAPPTGTPPLFLHTPALSLLQVRQKKPRANSRAAAAAADTEQGELQEAAAEDDDAELLSQPLGSQPLGSLGPAEKLSVGGACRPSCRCPASFLHSAATQRQVTPVPWPVPCCKLFGFCDLACDPVARLHTSSPPPLAAAGS